MRWLIAYDVVKPARLQRIYRLLCGHALPFQESVFLLRGTQAALLPLLHWQKDDLRVYPLPKGGLCKALGKAGLPDGVWLHGQ